ncbi:MAG: NAD-dependent epimerase/dehydratase family protein [Deltaproteobacteria bacterium]|nr:NAD-dependent epimerase/dehydratase family protein [Deltaproteobacteria bacterium]
MTERRSKRIVKDAAARGNESPLPTPRHDPEQRVVAVTGARGFIGAEIIKRLEEDRRYRTILALDIRKPNFPLDKTQFYKIDLTLPTADADIAALLSREGVDTLVHAAFLSSPTHASAWAHELEDIGTMHVLNACAEVEVRKLILSSTTMVYGAHPLNPNFLTEDHELKGNSSSRFLRDKVAAEQQVRRFRKENPETMVTVLRVAPTLGPTIENYVTRFFSRPIAPVMMGFDPLMQVVHERDVIDAFKLAIDNDVLGEFNIVGEGVLPYSTILALMGKLPLPLPHFLAKHLTRAFWVTQVGDAPPYFLDFLRFLCVADGRRAREILGFVPKHDIKATILDFLGVTDRPGDLVIEGGRA